MKKAMTKYNAISLFSSSGIGDLGLHANGISTVVSCELLPERNRLFQHNNPETKAFCGDIWELKDKIVDYYQKHYKDAPFLVLATPPCQGMSSNGMGTMLRNFKKGIRPKFDERNRLIMPALEIIERLRPEWVIFENVPNMTNTLILDEEDNLVNIIDYIYKKLGSDYVGKPTVIDVADYGVPQHRKRLITIFSRNAKAIKYFKENGTFIPNPTNGRNTDVSLFSLPRWITLRDAIGNLPPLRAEAGRNIDESNPLHKVPLLDETKLFWVSHTPEGATALNNQCCNPDCMYQGNTCHGTSHDEEGVNKSHTDTPVYCERCGALLPRPSTLDKETGRYRIMKAFTSAYKRMSWDEPASTLTQNFQYACSDNKLHPSQDRVLSLYEGLILQSIADYPYSFVIDGKQVPDGLIRDTIGESVPPKLIDLVSKHIIEISK